MWCACVAPLPTIQPPLAQAANTSFISIHRRPASFTPPLIRAWPFHCRALKPPLLQSVFYESCPYWKGFYPQAGLFTICLVCDYRFLLNFVLFISFVQLNLVELFYYCNSYLDPSTVALRTPLLRSCFGKTFAGNDLYHLKFKMVLNFIEFYFLSRFIPLNEAWV